MNMNSATAKPWLAQKMTEALGFEVDDIVEMVLGMGNIDDRTVYLCQLLGDTQETKDLALELTQKMGGQNSARGDDFWGAAARESPPPVVSDRPATPETTPRGLYKKQVSEDRPMISSSRVKSQSTKPQQTDSAESGKSKGGKKQKWKSFNPNSVEVGKKEVSSANPPREIEFAHDASTISKPNRTFPPAPPPLPKAAGGLFDGVPPQKKGSISASGSSQVGTSGKQARTSGGKPKFQPYVPGKEPDFGEGVTGSCKCMATEHPFLTNCPGCGRVACRREGWGACAFCRRPLVPADQGGPAQEGAAPRRAWEAAVALKRRLLEFDRTAAARTKVVDDQGDYFASAASAWLTQEEAGAVAALDAERREAVHTRRRDVQVSIDLAGRRVVEEKLDIAETEAKLSERFTEVLQGGIKSDENAPCAGLEISKQNIKNLHGRAKEVYEMLRMGAPVVDKSSSGISTGEEDQESGKRASLGVFLFETPAPALPDSRAHTKVDSKGHQQGATEDDGCCQEERNVQSHDSHTPAETRNSKKKSLLRVQHGIEDGEDDSGAGAEDDFAYDQRAYEIMSAVDDVLADVSCKGPEVVSGGATNRGSMGAERDAPASSGRKDSSCTTNGAQGNRRGPRNRGKGRRGGGGGDKACYVCGETGHMARECPRQNNGGRGNSQAGQVRKPPSQAAHSETSPAAHGASQAPAQNPGQPPGLARGGTGGGRGRVGAGGRGGYRGGRGHGGRGGRGRR